MGAYKAKLGHVTFNAKTVLTAAEGEREQQGEDLIMVYCQCWETNMAVK